MNFTFDFDLPQDVLDRQHSRAFRLFLKNWFGDMRALIRGEADLAFLNDLTPEERELARDLLRRNLKLKRTHIIEGVATLGDTASVPTLREMFMTEPNPSRRLTIAGALWKLDRDPVFIDCLEAMSLSKNSNLKRAHFGQILWLRDERAVDFLIKLLDDQDSSVSFFALSTLNLLEFGRRFHVPEPQQPHGRYYYRAHNTDADLRSTMVTNLRTLKLSGDWPEQVAD